MQSGTTCWTLIRGAASGRKEDLEEFARRYEEIVRTYFSARWRTAPDVQEATDATQAVFLECFKEGGVLDHVQQDPPQDFRAFLLGVMRNVALRFERTWARRREAPPPTNVNLDRIERSEATLSQVFDRAWAEAIVGEAAALHSHMAARQGDKAQRRVELLRLRFQEGLPIRDIASKWGMEPQKVHAQYEQARKEFERALLKVVHFHHPDSPQRARAELTQVLETLGGASSTGEVE